MYWRLWSVVGVLTLYSLAQVVSPPLLVDDRLVDLSSGEIVVFGETDV